MYAPSSHQVWAWRQRECITQILGTTCIYAEINEHVTEYLSDTKQQPVSLHQRSAFGFESSRKRVAAVAQLVAALHDEGHGVVVAGWQLVSVKDEDLGSRRYFLLRVDKYKRSREDALLFTTRQVLLHVGIYCMQLLF